MGNVDVARHSFLKISQSESTLLVVGEAGTGMIIFPVRRFGQTFAFFLSFLHIMVLRMNSREQSRFVSYKVEMRLQFPRLRRVVK